MSSPFNDLIFEAQRVHRRHLAANEVQMPQLLSIKTGGCPEDCGYCSQSAENGASLKASKLMTVEQAARLKEVGWITTTTISTPHLATMVK